jgi:hypothetical protein
MANSFGPYGGRPESFRIWMTTSSNLDLFGALARVLVLMLTMPFMSYTMLYFATGCALGCAMPARCLRDACVMPARCLRDACVMPA